MGPPNGKPAKAPKPPRSAKAEKPPKPEKAPKAEKAPKEPRAARSKVTKMAPITASGTRAAAPAGPKSRLKPLLAVLAVVVIGAGAFLFLTKGDDEDTPTEVAGTNVTRPDAEATPTTAATADPTTTVVATTLAPAPVSTLTPTQQRELCHVAVVGQVEAKPDTGDPLDTCTTEDFVAVSVEVGVYLRADPATDYRSNLTQLCATARSVGRNPLACEGIPTS